jgi:hypothetical protein
MKKKKLIALFITLALITSNLSAVFADDGAVPAPEGETQAGEPAAAEAPPQDPTQADAPVTEEPVGETEAETPADEEPVDQTETPVTEEPVG